MAIDIQRVKLSAEAHAAMRGYVEAAAVPAAEQAATAKEVAEAMQLPLGEVLNALRQSVWAGTGDPAHQKVTGGKGQKVSHAEQRTAPSEALLPHMVVIGGYINDAASMVKPSQVFKKLASDKPNTIYTEQPYNFPQTIKERAEKVDSCLPSAEGGTISKDLPKEILDLPVFRGMGGAGFNAASLRLLGYVIPEGHNQDYAGFKTSTHGDNIDATEWSLDPYVALKCTKGRGYLIESTLGELLDQGAQITRFAKDTEGGFFVTGAIKPRAKGVTNEGDQYQVGGDMEPPSAEAAQKAAKFLEKNLARAGGWNGFLAKDSKLAVALKKRGVSEAGSQLNYFLGKLEELPGTEGLVKAVRTRFKQIDPQADLDVTRKGINKLIQKVQMELAVRQDDGPNY